MKMLPKMAKALELTRAGRLADAAALLSQRLTSSGTATSSTQPIDLSQPLLPLRKMRAAPTSGAPSGMTQHQHSGPSGTLSYLLHTPRDTKQGMPLVIMLHGCTQSPEDFALGTGMNRLADEYGVMVAYPQQTQRANAQKCWNWFRPGDQHRDQGEPALIAGATRDIIAQHGVDPQRVYIAGLSAGGAAAAIMAAQYPDIYAAAGIHSGIACGIAQDVPSAFAAMKQGGGKRGRSANAQFVPVITFHGDRDNTVSEINSREIIAAASTGLKDCVTISHSETTGGREVRIDKTTDAAGRSLIEQWTVHGAGHAWSGGNGAGSYADASGPDASREMLRFFLQHSLKSDK